MHYTVTSQGSRYFEVYNEQNDSMGTLTLNTWWHSKGEINAVSGITYKIAPKGFWQTTFTITKNDMPFGEIKVTFGGRLRITFANENRTYTLKRKNLWKSELALYDLEDRETALVAVSYNWRKWKTDYAIDVHHNLLNKETNMVLPLILVFCARYLRMLQTAAVS